MKKLLSLVLAAAMLLTLLAGCGNPSAQPSGSTPGPSTSQPGNTSDPTPARPARKIAVAFANISPSQIEQQNYLRDYVGPAFNVEFMFSEAISDTEMFMTFIENAYAAGCEGIMAFQSDAIEQGSAKAEELGMYIINNNNFIPDSVSTLHYNLGSIGTSVPGVAALFRDVVEYLTSDGEDHNVIIVSGGASLGNNQHREATVAILETLERVYGLTYDMPIADLATTKAQTEVNTGTNIKIYIYPGYAGSDTYIPGFSSVLQTGDYDIVLSTYTVYTQFSVAIDEVERAFGKNIKLASIANLGEAAKNAFDTKDAYGNPSVDAVIINPSVVMVGSMFTLLFNAMEGNADQIRDGGNPSQYHLISWVAYGAEGYAQLEQLDIKPETYALQNDEIEALLVSNDDSVDFDTIYNKFSSMTVDYVKAARGVS